MTEFRVWAPKPELVRLDVDGRVHPMTRSDDGWWHAQVDAAPDARYGFLLDEGLRASWARHDECGRQLQAGLEALGFELFAAEGHRLPELTTAYVPERVGDEAKVRRTLLERYGIEIGGGLGAYAGKVWRIGCMGHTARPRNVAALLGALREVIGEP